MRRKRRNFDAFAGTHRYIALLRAENDATSTHLSAFAAANSNGLPIDLSLADEYGFA
jgi:hypothetical protein